MEENTNKPPLSRKLKSSQVDRDLVWKLACMQCTVKEIADAIGLNEATTSKSFGDLIEKGRSQGKKSLRRAQFEKAMNGDTRLLVWLGKQYLSQKDAPDSGDDTAPLPWNEND